MTKKDNINRNIIIVLMIVVAAIFRLLAFKYKELSNFNPVGAIALFGGAYFTDKWKGYLTVFVTLFATDLVLNALYHIGFDGLIGVYLAYAVIVFFGTILKRVSALNVLLASAGAVLVHWLLTDLPWLYFTFNLYPHTLAGYETALIAAIPFEYNMVYGTLVFSAIMFGGFELAKSKYAFLQTKKQLAL